MKAKIDKRPYERPRMTVVPLQHSTAVLQVSGLHDYEVTDENPIGGGMPGGETAEPF